MKEILGRLDDRSFEAEKGDIIFSPMAETVCIKKISSDYKAKYIFFSLDFISDAGFNYKSNSVIKKSFRRSCPYQQTTAGCLQEDQFSSG